MQTLTFHYQEIKDKLKTQLKAAETTEQTVNILQDEINKLADLNGDYIRSLTPSQARIAIVMLKELNQYTSILSLIKLQDLEPNAVEKSHKNDTLSPLTKVSQIEKELTNCVRYW
ncbi:hypothetical protein [Aetokthonos hydrillicola]|uniref:hypothetical protein n=1 Tax=Aetokthonos hydrillicola TaxID=1550245 RepID=UPI001ABA7DD9